MKSNQISGSSGGAINSLMDFGHQQSIVANESARAMFRGFEAMRKIQEEVAQEASQKHVAAAQKLRGGCSPTEIMAMQSDLMQFDFDAALRYWRELATTVLEMQTEIMGCTSHLLNSDTVLEGSAALAAPFRFPGLQAFFPANRRAEAH